MAIQAANIQDLVTTTLKNLGRAKWTDNSSDLRRTTAMKMLVNKSKMDMIAGEGGYEFQFNRSTGVGNTFRFVGLGAPDIVDITNHMGTGTIPWRHMTWNWAYDYREPLFNSGASRIVELIKTRRIAATGAAIIGTETAMWRAPAATDDTSIYGIPYWIVKSNTAATFANNDGFNGLAPSGYTMVAGINPTTDTRWRNYATQYTNVSKDDFIRKARRMAEYTNFTPLVDNTPTYDQGDKCEYYTNYNLYGTLVEILESQNENLGIDIAPYEGKPTFNRTKINNIPELDRDTTNPFYQIPWGVFRMKGMSGSWMKETFIPNKSDQHTISIYHTDCTLNTLCYDRRQCGVLATDTTMPS